MPTESQQKFLETERRVLELMRKLYQDCLRDLDLLLKQAINLGRLEQEFGGDVVRDPDHFSDPDGSKENPGVRSPVGRVP